MPIMKRTLKQQFITAINAGELGILNDYGVLVTQKAFSMYFSDVKTQYIYSFLSAATIDKSRSDTTRTKYLFRVKKGVYRVHPDILDKKPEKTPVEGVYWGSAGWVTAVVYLIFVVS